MKSTVIILGSHPRTRNEFDFTRDDCDIWVFNEAMSQGWVQRADAVFQLHREEIWRNPANRNDPGHAAWLKSGNTPVIYMHDVYDDVPMSSKYPLDEICCELLSNVSVSNGDKRYFTSSIAYAIALGIYLGYKRIEMYGVEMETNTEYQYQRDGVTFWLGIAAGNGVHVDVHSSIFDAPLYGYEGEAYLEYEVFERRAQEIEKQLPAMKADYEAKQKQAIDAYASFRQRNCDPNLVISTLMAQIDAGHKLGLMDGALQEIRRYMQKADTMKEASGGKFLFSRQEFEHSSQELARRREQAVTMANTTAGACQVQFNHAMQTKNQHRRKNVLKKFAEIAGQYIANSISVGVFTGAYQENMNMLQTLDVYIRAAGGRKSEEVLLQSGMAAGG